MSAEEFKDYILGFIFYKYLSEKILNYSNDLLAEDDIDYLSLNDNNAESTKYLQAIKEEAIQGLGYFLKPSELFS